MKSKKLRLRNFFQWSVCALVFLVMSSAHAADMNHYDIIDLANTDGLMPARLVPLPPEQTRIHEGMLDVTKAPYFADNTGTSDAHAAIQNAIDDAYLASLVVYFPSGTYLCSDNFTCFQTNLFGFRTSRKYTHKLVGSTEGPRPVLKLMDDAPLTYESIPGVGAPEAPLFIHFAWRGDIAGSYEEAGEKGYNLLFRGIDIDMGNNPSNSAIRVNAAQYSFIEDVHIYGTDFVWGVDGTPGGGGSVANVKVTGGKKGISITRTIPTIMGVTLEGQSELGLSFAPIGPGVVTGFSIKGPATPSAAYRAVYAYSTTIGDKAGNSNFVMVDGSIEVSGGTGVAIDSFNQDVHLQNVYVKAATIIESGHKKAPGEILAGDANSWKQVRRYACRSGNDSAPIVIDGVTLGTEGADHVYYEPLLTVAAPPSNLVSQHIWSEADFPSWEDAARVSITDFGAIAENVQGSAFDNAPAIQAALNSATTVGSPDYGKTVFIPRGIFNVSSPITVPAGSKLIGAGDSMAQIDVSTSWAPTAATSVLITEDDPTAEVVLAHFAIVCKEADEAGSGFPDTTAHRFIRHATIQSGKTLWRNIQLDVMNQSGVGRQRTEPLVQISNNAGGRFYTLVAEDSGSDNWAPGHPEAGYNKVRVSNTTLPISFYQLNPGHLRQATGQVRLDNCQDIRIYSLKSESKNTLRNLGATDVAHLQVFGSDGLHELTDSAAYVALIGQCPDVRIANLSHRLYSVYGLYYLNDFATGYTIPDRATLALYAKNAPQLRLYEGASISDPELFNGSTGADFGIVLTGGGSMEKTFTINNGGFADLTSLVVTIDGADSSDFVVSALGSTTVTPGGSTTFTITFTPSAAASRTATAHIASNDPGVAFDVSLVGEGSTSGNVNPVFGIDPIVKGNATEDSSYTGQTLAGSATDGNGDTLTYAKVSGPAWLAVASSGILSGTPSVSDVGLNSWTIQVSDGNGGTDTATLNITVDPVAGTPIPLPMLDSAFVKGGTDADTPQVWTDSLLLKNAGSEAYNRIGMIKVDASGISGTVDSATITLYDTDTAGHNLYVYGVNDSASFQNWTGGGSGSATWNSVIANGLFTPKVDLHTLGDANLTLLGSQTLTGTGSDTAVTISGQALVDFMNADTDGLVTLVVCTDMNANGINVRPHTHANASTLTVVFEGGSVNQPPAFGNDPINKANATEDAAYSGSIGADASDPEGDTLTYSKVSGPAWLSVATDGTLSGTPANSDVGVNAFTVQVDATGGSDTATLNITVDNVNDAPTFTVDPISGTSATEDAAYNDSISGTASDIEGDTLTYSKVSGPAWLSVATNGDLSGTPGNGDVGANAFTVQVSDGNGGTDAVTLNISVANVNDAPVFTVDPITGASAMEDVAYAGTISGSATDIDAGATLTYSKVSGPGWLSVAADGSLSGTPGNDFVGLNVLTVQVDDSNGGTDTAALNIIVVNVNDAPFFTADPITGTSATEDAAYAGTIAGSATDVDAGDTLTYSKVSGPAWLSVATDGTLSGTPANDDVDANAFTVQVSDGNGGTVTAVLNITVANVNDAPVFTADPITGTDATEDAAYTGTITGSATDVDTGDTLTYSKVSGPAWLSVATDGTLSGTPANDDVDANAFTVQASDGNGGTVTAVLNITVANVNDAPVFTVDPITGTEATEDAAYAGTIAGSATDVDAGDTLTYSKVSGPAWLSVATDGTLSGTPANDDVDTNAFTVQASDGNGGTVTAVLNITVANVNDAPVFTADPITGTDATEDATYAGTIAGSATDVDAGDTLTYSKVSGPAWLSVATDGTLFGTPANGDVGANAFTVQASDGNGGTVTAVLNITVASGVEPTWKTDADARIAQNRKGALKVVVLDESGNPLPSAAVDVQMQRHHFNFGAAIEASVLADAQNGVTLSSDDQNELNKILAYCNTVVFKNDLKWRNETSSTASLVNDALDFAEANRLAVRGHTILWPHEDKNGAVNHDFLLPDSSYSNSDIVDRWNAAGQTDTPDFTAWIQQSIADRINRMASTYPGRFFEWDTINEFNDADSTGNDIWLERRWSGDTIDLVDPAGGNYSPTTAGKQQLADIRAEWIKMASQANSGASLYLNNYNLMRFDPGTRYTAMANMLDSLNDPARANAPGALGGIGMQSHMSAEPTLPDDIWNRLEAYGSLDRNLTLSITEYDYVTTVEPIETNEADQLEYMLTQAYSHPQVDCFILWGIWDGNNWKDNGPMYDIDWNLKLSGQRFLDLVFGEWWTDESGTSDINGEYELDAFHGEHLVTVTVNGKVYQKTVTVDPSAPNQTVTVMSIADAPVVDSAFVHGGQADTPQAWTDELALKNSDSETYTRISMIKVDTSGISDIIDSAALTVYDTDFSAHSLYVYGVRDSASFQDWTGGGSGSATWNSVMTNGLFAPKVDLHTLGDANLTLLGSQALSGANAGDVAVTVSGQALVDLLNNDSDGLVTLVVCTDMNATLSMRPHTHANAPTLGLTTTTLPPAFGSDPLNKPDAFEDVAYSDSIAGDASDPEGNPITFSKISGPDWLTVSADGTLSGTPLASDAGLNTWTVQVSDSNYGTDTASLNINVIGNALPLLDSAFVRGGADADTPQAWTDALELKNASETYTRIGMIKVDASGISAAVDSATITLYDTDSSGHNLYVYGVNDSASFQNWTGGASGSATWNSVIANGLFTPKEDLYTLGDANLTLLGSQALAGANAGDVPVTVSGQALVDFMNADTDGLVTLVVCTDMNANGLSVRPHTHANAPALEVTLNGGAVNQPPVFGSDPINKSNATEDAAYTGSISADATDPEGDTLTYSKVSGPAWLSVATDGTLSGTPANSDVGANAFTVQVDAIGGTDTATLNITVEAAADTTPPAAPSGLSALAGIGSVELNWADNTEGDLGSYTVYRSTTSGSGYATLATDVTSSDYTDSAVVNHTTYYYVVTAVDTNSNESAQSSEASAQPGWVSDLAALDIAVEGTVSGALTDADVNDDTYQTITEVINGSTSALEHKWVFSVTGAELVTFYVEAHHSANSEGDDFVFAYSTDDVNYTDMVTVSKIADNNTVQYFALPSSLNGTVYVRVLDADRTGGNTQLDSIQVDVMVIVSEESTVAPGAASTPVPGDGAVNVANAQLSWTAGMMSASHDVYFGTTASPAFQGSQAGTVYDPGTLLAGTTYYWAIDEVNNSGTTAGSVWSFTTEAQNAAPTVSIVDPLNAQTFTEGSDIYVLANASDSDGSIDNLKLYLDGQFVRQENAAPYEWGAASQNDPLLQNMSAGTYVLEVIVTDNEGATATNSISITVETSAPVWTELSFEDFESGFGSWVGGGGDVLLSVDNAMGTQCLDIQDNSGDASSSWLANSLDVTGYTELKVEFTYMPISMDGSEDFWLQISDDGGSTWTTVKAFVGEVDFFNGTRENPVVTIDSGSYNFTSNVKLKFRCDASGNKDDIYIDEVRISGQ